MTSSATLPESLEIPDPTKLPLLTGDYSFPAQYRSAAHSHHRDRRRSAADARRCSACSCARSASIPLPRAAPAFPIQRMVMLALAIAGALGGLAGGFMLLGDQYVLKDGFSSGYGFDGLVAGLLARGSIVGVIAAALLFGFLRSGGINMEMVAGVPTALVMVIQGLIVVTLAGAAFFIGSGTPMTWELFAVFIGSSLRLAVPLLLAGTGELVSERAGVLNMSIEGMMLTGAFGAAVGAWATGNPVLGLLIGIIAVIPGRAAAGLAEQHAPRQSDRHRHRHQHSGAGRDHARLSRNLRRALARADPGSGEMEPAAARRHSGIRRGRVPAGVAALCRHCHHRPDGAGAALHRARHCHPRRRRRAARGRQIGRLRHLDPVLGVFFAGFMSALAGAFLSIGDIHTFTEGMTRGAGYLAIAAVIFGKWTLTGTVLACLLFGAATALQFQLPTLGVNVPNAFLIMLPYLLALLAVGGLAGRQTAPRALGEPYIRR